VHQHIQFGTGTLDPLVVAAVSRQVRGFTVGLNGQARLGLYPNGRGYQGGHRFGVGLSGQRLVGRNLTASLSADLAIEQAERWDGRVMEDGNLGRTDGLLGVTLAHPVGPVHVRLGVKVPVFSKLTQHGDEAAQLAYPAIVELDLSWLREPVAAAAVPPGG